MGHPLNPKSSAFRVLAFFLRNHEEELKTSDIALKFDIPLTAVFKTLSPSVREGMLARTSPGAGRGRDAVYVAGDALLAMIGEHQLLARRRASTMVVLSQANAPEPLACVPIGGWV